MEQALLITGVLASLVFFIPFAIEIWRDAERRVKEGQPLLFFSAPAWAFMVVWSGALGIGLYWLMHYFQPNLDRGGSSR
jgi:hypothetical protein